MKIKYLEEINETSDDIQSGSTSLISDIDYSLSIYEQLYLFASNASLSFSSVTIKWLNNPTIYLYFCQIWNIMETSLSHDKFDYVKSKWFPMSAYTRSESTSHFSLMRYQLLDETVSIYLLPEYPLFPSFILLQND